MRKRLSTILVLGMTVGLLSSVPASADHTDPNTPQAPITGAPPGRMTTFGAGTWEYIQNFAPNPGTDLEFWTESPGQNVYAATGTLGQADVGHVGQRITQLLKNGAVNIQWRADHGSAHCTTRNPSGTTGLQHDSQIAQFRRSTLLIDTTDATGRCHDPTGGGLEIVDVSLLNRPAREPREIHLTRHAGTSHTHTVDASRPWIVYNSSSDFAGRPWIDVLDISSCLLIDPRTPLQQKRELCRPDVYRIPFQPEWSQLRNWYDGQLRPGTEAACHDITAQSGRLYCASLNATLIFDVSGLTDAQGNINGTPLPCTLADGTSTTAKVTDCSAMGPERTEQATGWQFLGTFNHPGRDCAPPPVQNYNCNNNLFVEADDGVSVSHEADPTRDQQFMFVTDERGGGVVPPGASCSTGVDNPYGNGGIHTFDISDPSNIEYALTPTGDKAVWRSEILAPNATFCDVHVIEHIPGENRLIVAYYSSGTKIVDYFIDDNGRITFQETASLILPNNNVWAVEDFKIVDNGDGTRTYFFLADDIQRGIDIFKWTGPTNFPSQARAVAQQLAAEETGVAAGDAGLLVLGLIVLPAAARIGRRRRASR
jgi:hypothetical protein